LYENCSFKEITIVTKMKQLIQENRFDELKETLRNSSRSKEELKR